MNVLNIIIRKFLYGIPLIIGVTLISFLLMVYFGPDRTYSMLGKNATAEDIANVRHQLGYDRPLPLRYGEYLWETVTMDFGHSDSNGEKVTSLLTKSVPISLALTLPGFILGNVLAILIALWAAVKRGTWQDKFVMGLSVVGMSISFIIVIISLQYLLSSSYGLNLFPVSGWDVTDLSSYLNYVTVPTLCLIVISLGYYTRFYRAVFVEEMNRDHLRTARAYGASLPYLLHYNVFRNSLIPISTRLIFSIPFVLIGGNLLLESYFSVPGVGLITYNAITTGDLPVLKAVVSLTAILYVLCLMITDIVYALVDPRVSLR